MTSVMSWCLDKLSEYLFIYLILHNHLVICIAIQYHHHQSLVRVERRGVAWDATFVITRHLVRSCESLRIVSAVWPVHRVMLSSHLVLGLPLPPPSTIRCIIILPVHWNGWHAHIIPFSSVSSLPGDAREAHLRPLSHLSPNRWEVSLSCVACMRSSGVFCSIGAQMLVFCSPLSSSSSTSRIHTAWSWSLSLLAIWLDFMKSVLLCHIGLSLASVSVSTAMQTLISDSKLPSVVILDPIYFKPYTASSFSSLMVMSGSVCASTPNLGCIKRPMIFVTSFYSLVHILFLFLLVKKNC